LLAQQHDDKQNAHKYYELGKQAESKQLPMFLPYDSAPKKLLDLTMGTGLQDLFAAANPSNSSSSNNKQSAPPSATKGAVDPRLDDPRRRKLICEFRGWLNTTRTMQSPSGGQHVGHITLAGKLKQTKPVISLDKLRPIVLSEMDPLTEKVYQGRVLHLIVVGMLECLSSFPPLFFDDVIANGECNNVEPPAFAGTMTLLVEDSEGRVERFQVHKFTEIADGHDTLTALFCPGRNISVCNPYFRISTDHMGCIRVDDPRTIIIDDPESHVRVCSCCLQSAATLQACSKCKIARYCSRECQLKDWKEFEHKTICK
jgi:hypothetical protein